MSANRTVTTRRSSPTTASCAPQVEQKRAELSLTEPQDGQVILEAYEWRNVTPHMFPHARRTRDDRRADLARVERPPASTPQEPSHECDACQRARSRGRPCGRRREVLRLRRHGGGRSGRRHRRLRPRPADGHHGPVRVGQVHPDALHGRARHPHVGAGVRGRRGPAHAGRQGAHPAPARPARVHLPGLQPHPDAHRAREHHAPRRAGRARARSAVARPRGRHRRARGPPHPPAERAVGRSAAARRSGAARSPNGPSSSSPTSRPATSIRGPAARSSGSCRPR